MTKTRIFLLALVTGLIYNGYFLYHLSQPTGEFWGGIYILEYIFIGLILIPLVYGIVSLIIAKQQRLAKFFRSFGISFAVMLPLGIATFAYFQIFVFSKYQSQPQNADPCGTHYTGSITCEEYQRIINNPAIKK